MAYDVDTLIDNLMSLSAGAAGNAGAVINELLAGRNNEAPKFEPLALQGPSVTLDNLAPVLSGMSDTSGIAKLRDDLTQSSNKMISGLDGATDDINQFLDKLKTDLRSIQLSQSDFDPTVLTNQYNSAIQQLVNQSKVWMQEYLDAYSPISMYNVNAANAQLAQMIAGMGLPANVIDSIWQQGRDQVYSESLAAEQQVWGDYASRGYPMPTGALNGALQNIRMKRAQQVGSLSRDVAVKQAEIIIDLMKFGTELALSTRQKFLDSAVEYLRAYLTPLMGAFEKLYVLGKSQKVDYVTAMNKLFIDAADANARVASSEANIYGEIARLAVVPYDVQAKYAEALTRVASIDVEQQKLIASIKEAYDKMGLDYKGQMDVTNLRGYYGITEHNLGAAASAVDSYARIGAAALAGINAIASIIQVSVK